MARTFASIVPDGEALLAMEPEELAGVLIEYLHALPQNERWSLNRYSVLGEPGRVFGEYPKEQQNAIADAMVEAWVWLEREGLLVPRRNDAHNDFLKLSRRGERIATRANLAAYRGANVLPKGLIHPRIVQKVWTTFIRGEYDTAVFQAFKEVEVAVRGAAKLLDTDIGVALMRKAFEKNGGPLTDVTQPDAEREALAHLFAGAIGLFKNPQSHRHVELTDAGEAAELIMFASSLLRMVDARTT